MEENSDKGEPLVADSLVDKLLVPVKTDSSADEVSSSVPAFRYSHR